MRKRTTTILVSVTTLALAAALWSGVAVASSSTTSGGQHSSKGVTLSFDVKFSPFFLIDFGLTGVRSVTDISQSDPSKGD
ncbi:MAG: hypothetical protein ACXV3A_02410, partial [Kineosporiaceae bacterium]